MGVQEERMAAVPGLLAWYEKTARPLPWRTDASPYRVWVSEIMLQQTRIEAVLPYFDRFLAAFPTIDALAAAPEDQVLKLWEGLGYYSRAKNLQKTARLLVAEYGGRLPETAAQLRRLPGIGPYTAGAIASIAFGQPAAAVDGNVLRVTARLTADRRDVTDPATKKAMTTLVESLIPSEAPGAFTQALMELGERVCLPNGVPLCDACPMRDVCHAYKEGTQLSLPVRGAKKPRRIEALDVFVLVYECEGQVALEKRPASGLLPGLWQFPNAPAGTRTAADFGLPVIRVEVLPPTRHIFTHVQWEMNNYLVAVTGTDTAHVWLTPAEIAAAYALPSAFKKCWAAGLKRIQ